jgi:hypothetical protein
LAVFPPARRTANGIVLPAVGVLAVAGYIGFTTHYMALGVYDVWGGLIVLPALVLVSLPLLRAAGREEPDPRVRRLIFWGFALKIGAALPRYWMAFVLYRGVADASGYAGNGEKVAASIWAGHPNFDVGPLRSTGFVRLLTGLVYTVTGPSMLAGFLVFSWFGFWGLYLFYRAFRTAIPDGDALLYARLVLLLPSLLFWPSSIGKEAFITLTLGIAAYGAARVLTWARGGFPLVVLGSCGTALVRPHVALLFFMALAIAYVLRRARPPTTALTPIAKTVGVVVLLILGSFVLRWAESFLGVDSFNSQTVNGWLDQTAERTDEGGSTFTVLGKGTPLQYPFALLTVLFRPFPFEVHNIQALATALEGLFLLILMIRFRRRILGLFVGIRRHPYVALCILYTLLFAFAFSQISNFGIIARQRVQLLPFAIALLCVRTRQEIASASSRVDDEVEPRQASSPTPVREQ